MSCARLPEPAAAQHVWKVPNVIARSASGMPC